LLPLLLLNRPPPRRNIAHSVMQVVPHSLAMSDMSASVFPRLSTQHTCLFQLHPMIIITSGWPSSLRSRSVSSDRVLEI
jgi:hypothetical protein